MKFNADIYYSSQNQAYEKAKGYVIDDGARFCIGFNEKDYGFEIKNNDGNISVVRSGEQSYSIFLTRELTDFTISTPYGSLRYKARLLSYNVDKKTNSYSVSLSYLLIDSSGHEQKNELKLRGMIK